MDDEQAVVLVAQPAAARSTDAGALGGSRGDGPRIIDEVHAKSSPLQVSADLQYLACNLQAVRVNFNPSWLSSFQLGPPFARSFSQNKMPIQCPRFYSLHLCPSSNPPKYDADIQRLANALQFPLPPSPKSCPPACSGTVDWSGQSV